MVRLSFQLEKSATEWVRQRCVSETLETQIFSHRIIRQRLSTDGWVHNPHTNRIFDGRSTVQTLLELRAARTTHTHWLNPHDKLFVVSLLFFYKKIILKFPVFDRTNFILSHRLEFACFCRTSKTIDTALLCIQHSATMISISLLFDCTLSRETIQIENSIEMWILTSSDVSATESLAGKHARAEWWHLSCSRPWETGTSHAIPGSRCRS